MSWRDKIAKFLTAYHSSPHDVDKFSLSKVGTGEGHQVYGHGLYYAQSPEVSGRGGHYWDQFMGNFTGAEAEAAAVLRQHGFDRQKAADYWEKMVDSRQGNRNARDSLRSEPLPPSILERDQEMLRLLKSDLPIGPRTYEVNLHTTPDRMLNLDVGYEAQSPFVQERLRALGVHPQHISLENSQRQANDLINTLRDVKGYAPWVGKDLDELQAGINTAASPRSVWMQVRDIPDYYGFPGGKSGWVPEGAAPSIWDSVAEDAYARLAKIKSDVTPQQTLEYVESQLGGRVPAAEKLRSVEIPGSRYHDELSRNLPQGDVAATSNYVVNDPSIIEIAKKYGVVGAPAGTIGGLAAQDQYEVPR